MKKDDGSYICDICQSPIHPNNLAIREVHIHLLCENQQKEIIQKKIEEHDKAMQDSLNKELINIKKAIKRAFITFLIYTLLCIVVGIYIGIKIG